MKIKKYIFLSFIIVLISAICYCKLYRFNFQRKINEKASISIEEHESIAKVDGKLIKLYNNGKWNDFEVRGVKVTSFYPSYERCDSSIDKEKVKQWIKLIKEANANTILIPYIQPVNFYEAVYEYNLENEEPIYMIHSIALNLRTVSKEYDAFDEKFYKEVQRDIINTINVVHGNAFLLDNSTHHTGLFLKDISKYNLGYILGFETTPELIKLTNSKHTDIKSFDGKYYKVENSEAYDVFIAQMLDKIRAYEIEKYNQSSIISYVATVETDPFYYENESKLSQNAQVDLKHLKIKEKNNNSIFASIAGYINDADFLDYDNTNKKNIDGEDNFYYRYLERYSEYYDYPVIVADMGVSSSRGKSNVNLSEGYDRGNNTEIEQGEILVELLEFVKKANINGAIIGSWQDEWGRTSTPNLTGILDKDTSVYWHDVQASDESFGLLSFDIGKENRICNVDGDIAEWNNVENIIQNEKYNMKVMGDSEYLYVLINKKDLEFYKDEIYLGINVIGEFGSNKVEDNAEYSIPVNFSLRFKGAKETSMFVQDRYNIFNYKYKYHEYILEKQDYIPSKDTDIFSPIYLLNRKKIYVKKTGNVEQSIYYETGQFKYGIANPENQEYDSLADFYRNEDNIEVRIPWGMLNFKNPIDGTVLGDIYAEGIDSERKIQDLSFALFIKDSDNEKLISEEGKYNLSNIITKDYHERLKKSYYILKEYWNK